MHPSPSQNAAPSRRRRRGTALPWLLLLLDALLVLGFAAMGNRNHATGRAVGDVAETGAPFLIGLLVSSVAIRFWRHPSKLWPDSLVVILGTVTLGMMLRVISGAGGAQISFILVSLVVLGVLLFGRRLVSHRLTSRRRKVLEG